MLGLRLHEACEAPQSLPMIRTILERRPEAANVATKDGNMPIHTACLNQASDTILKTLVRHNPECLAQTDAHGNYPLHLAAFSGAPLSSIKYLVHKHPETIFESNENGETPLDRAKNPFFGVISKDVVDWLDQMGYYDMPIDEHPQKETVRHRTNHYLTGRDGGRESDLRQFATEGMQLYGRLQDIDNDRLYFKADLKQNLDSADAVAESIKETVDRFIEQQQLDIPPEAPYCPIWEPPAEPAAVAIADANIGSVIWSTGYHTNFRWIEVPVFDGQGYPCHDRGVTAIKGVYFIGLPWLYTWGSGRFSGVARDAQYIADHLMTKRKFQSPLLERSNEMAIGS